MTESAFNRPVPVQEQQAALKAEPKPKSGAEIINDEMLQIARDIQAREEAALVGLDTVSRGAIVDGLRENPIVDFGMTANEPDVRILSMEEARELTAEEASRAIEAAMQERIAEAIDNDIETRARIAAIPESAFAAQITEERGLRYEGTFQGNPIVSDPSLPPGFVGAVHLTAEQLEATKHLKPGEAWAKAGEALEPEPAKKPEDLDGF